MLALPPRRLAREGIPIAVILLFWNLLAVVAEQHEVGGAVRNAGFVMAALYVVVRGAGLASETVGPATGDPKAVLAENVRLAVPAGAWFVGAVLVFALDANLYRYHPSLVATVVGSALAGAGLGVVGLYAVAAGFATFGSEASSEAPTADD